MDRMLLFSPKLYIGNDLKGKNIEKLVSKIKNHPLWTGAYLLTLSRNSSDQIDIFDVRQLQQSFYRNHTLRVVGIAKNYDDALNLIQQITEDCLANKGDCNLKEYLEW